MSVTAVGEMPDPDDRQVIEEMEVQIEQVPCALPEIRLYTDRCDYRLCDSQAFMIAQSPVTKKVLTFCGHHGRLITPNLAMAGFEIEDQFQRLTSAPAL